MRSLTMLPSSAPAPMPTLYRPENSAMATSVASEARRRTRDCWARPKHMIDMPQSRLSAISQVGCADSGNSSARLLPKARIAASRKPRGKASL